MTDDDLKGGLTDKEVEILGANVANTLFSFDRQDGEFHFVVFVLTRKNEDDEQAVTDMVSSFSREGVEEMLRTWLGRKAN